MCYQRSTGRVINMLPACYQHSTGRVINILPGVLVNETVAYGLVNFVKFHCTLISVYFRVVHRTWESQPNHTKLV